MQGVFFCWGTIGQKEQKALQIVLKLFIFALLSSIVYPPSRGESDEPGQDGNVAALNHCLLCGGFFVTITYLRLNLELIWGIDEER